MPRLPLDHGHTPSNRNTAFNVLPLLPPTASPHLEWTHNAVWFTSVPPVHSIPTSRNNATIETHRFASPLPHHRSQPVTVHPPAASPYRHGTKCTYDPQPTIRLQRRRVRNYTFELTSAYLSIRGSVRGTTSVFSASQSDTPNAVQSPWWRIPACVLRLSGQLHEALLHGGP